MRIVQNPAETEGREERRGGGWWADAGGLVAPLVALVLWIVVVAGIAAPLGAALVRMDARRAAPAPAMAEQAPCPLPPGALASAARAGERARCR
jgi:hypothetical protein